MKTSSLILEAIRVADESNIDAHDILKLAQQILDFHILNLAESEDDNPTLLCLMKDASILLINMAEVDETTFTWEVHAFPDPGLFEEFIRSPDGKRCLPAEAIAGLLRSYDKSRLINTLEPGHA